jgi:hypothetical protein
MIEERSLSDGIYLLPRGDVEDYLQRPKTPQGGHDAQLGFALANPFCEAERWLCDEPRSRRPMSCLCDPCSAASREIGLMAAISADLSYARASDSVTQRLRNDVADP